MKRTGQQHQVGCSGKKGMTREAAHASAEAIRRRTEDKVLAYHCSHCKEWHVGGAKERGELNRTKAFKRRRRQAFEI